MSVQSFTTRNKNDLQKKESELTGQGFQQVMKNRLDPGEYRITNSVDADSGEAVYTIDWIDFDYAAETRREQE